MLDFFLGTVKENAARELANYDFETQTRKKDLGDILGDFFTGRGSAIDQAVKDAYIRRLKGTQDGRSARSMQKQLGNDLSPEELNRLKITAGTDPLELEQAVLDNQGLLNRRKSLINAADASGYGLETDKLSTPEISSKIRKLEEQKQTDRDNKIYGRELERENRALELQLLNQRFQRERDDLRMGLENRRLDMADRADQRRARDAQMMMIMKGLQAYAEAMSL